MPELAINDSATWRTLIGVEVNDSGTWRTIQTIEVNDSGTWRTVFVNDVISIVDSTSTSSDVLGNARYSLTSAGDINQNLVDNTLVDTGDWITPKTNMANYEARATLTSGTFSSGTAGSWLALSSTRSWGAAASPGSSKTTVFTLEIRRASDGVVLDTATITLFAESD